MSLNRRFAPSRKAGAGVYSTTFDTTENPLSDGGQWTCGGTVGLDWQDPETANGRCIASAVSAGYDDCNAVLSGFTANHYAQGVVYLAGGYSPGVSHELELLVRFKIEANVARGYEFLFTPFASFQVFKWLGAYNSFSSDLSGSGTPSNGGVTAIADGDVMRVEAEGTAFRVYQNGVLKWSITDSDYSDGNPGLACFARDGATLASLGWASYEAGNL